jgi:toxin ParE1/3/4
MAVYRLTNKAATEIERIYEYSIANFGLHVAQNYLLGLQDCFQWLAEYVNLGTDYGIIAPELRRYEYRSHSIYFKPTESGILILRVLGSKQDPARHING